MVQSLLLEQAAELLGVSRRTVYYRIREGRLRTVRARCGSQRVLIESIEELLREQSERARQRAVGSLITDSEPAKRARVSQRNERGSVRLAERSWREVTLRGFARRRGESVARSVFATVAYGWFRNPAPVGATSLTRRNPPGRHAQTPPTQRRKGRMLTHATVGISRQTAVMKSRPRLAPQ